MRKSYFLLFKIFSIGMVSILFSILAMADDKPINKHAKLSQIDLNLTSVEKKWLKDHQTIKIAGPRSFPPFHYFDEKEVLKGISADYIYTIMNTLGIKVEVIKNIPWPEVLKKAKAKQIDLISCAAKTDDRETYLTFSSPYLSFPLVIINRRDSSFIGGIQDLHGKKLAVIEKNSTNDWLKRDGIKFISHYVTSPLKGLEAVSFGEADARIENLAAASYLMQKNGLTNLKIAAPSSYGNYNLHIAVRKDWPQLIHIINKALGSMSPEQHIEIRSKLISIRYEHGITKADMFKWILGIAFFSAILLTVVLIWNSRLKKESAEHKQTAKKLQTSERRFSEIIEGVSEIAIQGYDEKRKVTFWNQASQKMYGYSKQEALGNKLEDLIIPQGMRETVKKLHHRWIEFGEKIPAGEHDLTDKNNNIVSVYSSHVLHETSAGKEMFCIDIDMRPIRKTEAALRKNEKKYRHLFKNAPAGMYEIDFEKLIFLSVNEVMCDYSGYSEEEFLCLNPLDLLTNDSKNIFLKRLEKLLSGEKIPNTVELTLLKKEGQEIVVILNNDFIFENKKIKGAQVVVHDITELKQAQDEKIKAQKIAAEQEKLALVGQIAGKMAHDFNNILGIIMGNTELSLFDCKDTETKKSLELILEQTIRGKNLTRNLVSFAKDQEPRQDFFLINEKIDLVLTLLRKDLEGIELIREDKPGVSELLADPGMIEHAIVNLVQNSIHALSKVEHPQIIIRTYGTSEMICFEIEDNGCGIPKGHFENIYQPSFTLKGSSDETNSYKRGIKGTGYGMSNIKKYIELHKGNIFVSSVVGSGTKFTISLPIIHKELTKEEKIQIRKEKSHSEKYILLVEDETAISNIQHRTLTQDPCHHKVDIAQNGQAAIDLFKKNNYDFVSLDYILPGNITGMDVYHSIRKKNKTIPILFISGNINFLESIKELKQKDPGIDHVSKPCQNKDYITAINKLMERVLSAY